MSEQGSTHRRRRRRATAAQGPPPEPTAAEPAIVPEPAAAPEPAPAPSASPQAERGARRRPREGSAERGLRDLVGAGHSVLGVSGALRGRDVNRPTDDDLAEAERDVQIVRRHWQPRDGQ